MKNGFLLIALLLFLVAPSCKKEEALPACIEEKITALLMEDCPSVSRVERYTFKGEIVYLFSPKACGNDFQSDIYNESCELICSLGGIAGIEDCDGKNFQRNARNRKLMWEE